MEPCSICQITEQNEVEFGEFLYKNEFSVHYFCLLFSTSLKQRGTSDTKGIRRFLLKDIQSLICTNKKRCTYCKKKNATVSCHHKNCKEIYHFICGLRNYCFFEFSGQFVSYCNSHGGHQNHIEFNGETICCCCYERIESYNPATVLRTCSMCINTRPLFVHILCVKKLALAAGYDFKCPGCRSDIYREEVKLLGVYVPDRSATWETPNLISSTQFNFECEAMNCICPNGKTVNSEDWPIFICKSCGTFGLHKQCARKYYENLENYVCQSCVVLDRGSPLEMTEDSDDLIMLVDDIETITVSSGPLCVSKRLVHKLEREQLNAFLMAPIEEDPLDPWDNDDQGNEYGLRF